MFPVLESKSKFMEKIGVRSISKLRRRSVATIQLRSEKSSSYPSCHAIHNDTSILELGKILELLITDWSNQL